MAYRPLDEQKLTHSLDISIGDGIAPLTVNAQNILLTIAAQVARAHPLPEDICLVLVDDDHMSQLNSIYRNKEGTTDVLSFDLGSTPGQTSSGEIYISQAQAQRQALALAVPPFEELARLLVHGLLHLSGWVHDTPKQLRAMERETEVFLSVIDLEISL